MPKLIIDNRSIEVAPGTKVIDAAEQLGIMIPRFCYHRALGAVGACRVCAVKFIKGPVKGIQMSCMIDAHDGMVVSTTDAEAVDFRRHVIEWLMLHHPHDCPVCDEGGHCLLQDMTVAGGHGRRRYLGPKRTYPDQYLGPLLQHEMNRCIQCYRCSRYYREFTGYRDLGVMRIASRVYFGRQREGTLESPFAGNLADICPTGVFTDKPSRFFGRRWDYERTPGLCIACSLGCRTVVSVRNREVVRQQAHFSSAVNGYFICDRGRHAYVYASDAERPRRALLDGSPTNAENALGEASRRLRQIEQQNGPAAVALWGSARSSLETLGAACRLAQSRNWRPPALFQTAAQSDGVRAALADRRAELVISMQQVEAADVILTVGADPLNEAPMLVLAMRQAARNGARVFCLDPRPVSLPFDFRHLAVRSSDLSGCVQHLVQNSRPAAGADRPQDLPGPIAAALEELVLDLKEAGRPVLIHGTDIINAETIGGFRSLAQKLKDNGAESGLFALLPEANAFGAGMLSEVLAPGASGGDQLLADIESGRVRALLLVENNPFWSYPDRSRLQDALARLDLLVVMDYLPTQAVERAHVFLPTATIYESGGIFVNQEGRAQAAKPAYRGGRPITQTGGGGHPPRRYDEGLPGSEPASAWHWLSMLAADERSADEDDLRSVQHWLAERIPQLEFSAGGEPWPPEGVRLETVLIAGTAGVHGGTRTEWEPGPDRPPDALELLAVEQVFGTEELSCRSPQLQALEAEPVVWVSASDAPRLQLAGGETANIETGIGMIAATVSVSERTAAGSIILPRHRRLMWQRMNGYRTTCGIRRKA
jgi:NADH-quinone oxidoreductase subunit G